MTSALCSGKKFVSGCVLILFCLVQVPAFAAESKRDTPLRKVSDQFYTEEFSEESGREPTAKALDCVYGHIEQLPDELKLILIEKGVIKGFESLSPDQKKKYKKDEEKFGEGFFKCALEDAFSPVLEKLTEHAVGPYKLKAYDSDAKSNIHNIWLACKAFWREKNKTCNVEDAKKFGYVQS